MVSRSRSPRVPWKLVSKADEVKTRAFFLERRRSKTRLPANFHLQLACRISCLEYHCTFLPLLRCVPPIFTHRRRNGKLFMSDNFARGAVRNCCVSIQCTRGTRKSQSRGRKRWRRWQESEALRKEEWARAPERWERERCIMRKWRKGNEESGLRLASKGPTRFSAGAINGDFYLR